MTMPPSVVAGVSSDPAATSASGATATSESGNVDRALTSAVTMVSCTVIASTPASTKYKTSTSDTDTTISDINNPPHIFVESAMFLKHKRRYCRKAGCNSIVKSQGLCQRHGAKPKTCKVDGCTKQAQGNFDKMCKAHFKAMKRMTTPIPKVTNTDVPPPAQGFSVYDEILPNSLNFVNDNSNDDTDATDTRKLPLIVHLKYGFDTLKPPAWHRNEERRARGMFPIDNPAAQLEGWERELVWMEILVLTGVPGASFRHLARAWGRDKGFHMVLAQFICERHGDVERKKRHGEKNNNSKTSGDDSSTDGSRKKHRKASTEKGTSNPNNNNRIEFGDNSGSGNSGDYNNEDVGADVWDPSLYGDVDTNEALAAEIFDFTEKEFERVVSKYKMSSDISVSTSTTSNNTRNRSTDIAAQAAMTAILGQQQQRTSSSGSISTTGHGQMHHHRSISMLSNASNGSSATNNNNNNNHQEDIIIPTPVHVEVTTAAATHHQHPATTTGQSQIMNVPVQQQILDQNHTNSNHPNPSTMQSHGSTLAPLADVQSYHDHLTSLHGDAMYAAPQQQQQQQQQQIFQDQSRVQTPPIQVIGHTYQQQQYAMSSREGQAQGQDGSHHIMQQQQQPTRYNMPAPAPSAQEIQPHAQALVQLQKESQSTTQQQISNTAPPTPAHLTQQPEAHSQPFSQPISYALPSRQQQHQHAVTSVPAPAQSTQLSQPQEPVIQDHQQQQQQHQQQQQYQHQYQHQHQQPAQPTQFSQPQAPVIQQQQQQHHHQQHQHQMNHLSYPQHEQDHSNSLAPQHVINVSYEQQQHQQLQNYGTAVTTNPLSQQSHQAPQQMVHIPVPYEQQQQQQQQQYTQTNIAPEPAQIQLTPQGHQQHQVHFPRDEHQQILAQVQAQSQGAASSLPQVGGQQIVHPSYPQQHQQEQEHLNQQLMNHPTHEPAEQDPLDVHHEMHATRQDQTDM
jgi:hypothetical protein